ncbi:unnamed protein product [Boreogadus saida]
MDFLSDRRCIDTSVDGEAERPGQARVLASSGLASSGLASSGLCSGRASVAWPPALRPGVEAACFSG